MHLLVTAGPTREYLDDVRFISNASTGAMGYAVAEAAAAKGHSVVLITGPVAVEPPEGAELVEVVSALDMQQAVESRFAEADAVVMTAAVCDYRPEKRVEGKIKKTGDGMTLRLEQNPDILARLGRLKQDKILVGFALEAGFVRDNALEKLRSKNLDFVVLDTPEAMGARRATFIIIAADGSEEILTDVPKRTVAERITRLIQQKGRT